MQKATKFVLQQKYKEFTWTDELIDKPTLQFNSRSSNGIYLKAKASTVYRVLNRSMWGNSSFFQLASIATNTICGVPYIASICS